MQLRPLDPGSRPSTGLSPALVPAVSRALTLLERLAQQREPMSLARLASELELPKSSVHGLCNTLLRFGYLHRQDDGAFRIGPGVMPLAEAFVAGTGITQEFNALWLDAEPDETIILSVLNGPDVVYIAARNGRRPLGLAFNVGMRLPAHLARDPRPDQGVQGLRRRQPRQPEGAARHIHALIGPNGAGKTTCFNLLTKFLRPPPADPLQRARHHREKPAQIARRGVIRSFQISAVFPHLTVLENVRVGAAAQAGHLVPLLEAERTLDQLHDRALELLDEVGLRDYAGTRSRRRAALRPQARAGDRHHAGDGARTDAARRADAGHGPRGRGPRHAADQEGRGRPHRADGRAQHERGRRHRRPHHRAAARRHLAEGPYARCRRTRR
jgi:hypothetical protein